MRVVIVAVGRPRDPDYRELIDEYLTRIRRYAVIDEVRVRDDGPIKVRDAILKALTSITRNELIALDVQGQQLGSEAFAHKLGVMLDRAAVPVFAIGGAEGLPPEIRSRASWKLSLGPMTLPHRLARLVLAEQIYRGFTILRGEPYAREN